MPEVQGNIQQRQAVDSAEGKYHSGCFTGGCSQRSVRCLLADFVRGLITIYNFKWQGMMMKRKSLSVAVSVALAAGAMMVSQGVLADARYINDGETLQGQHIINNGVGVVDIFINGGTSFNNTFDNTGQQSIDFTYDINNGLSGKPGENYNNLFINIGERLINGVSHDNTYSRGSAIVMSNQSFAHNNRIISGSNMYD